MFLFSFLFFSVTGLTLHPLALPGYPPLTHPPPLSGPGYTPASLCQRVSLPRETGGSHLPVYSVFISLESVVNGGAHAGRHGVGVGGVRVLVRVQLGPVVEVHRLHGPGAVRVSVHGGRDAHPVHRVVGQVFVLHTTQHAGPQ